ncbi:MAG TPA: lysophospholipid acyltransferase family protein [Vicinamibacterales bacterium]|nr:lysophospholipid acyltransferase family protein [Vicinamibacterales bacterium]
MPLGRAELIGAITTFLGGRDERTMARMRTVLERELDAAGAAALEALNLRLETAGIDWTYYPADPLARRVHHALAEAILDPRSTVAGLAHLASVSGRPTVLLANHLSYSDANLLEILLHRAGATHVADRLTVVAGPKVYSSLKRRFSSLCFGTIKTPQSTALSSDDAVMHPREVARLARQCIDIALDRIRRGETLLVFAEGTRSRTCGMQPTLAGVARYLEWPGTQILPVGLTGTEVMFPIGEDALHDVPIVARIGNPVDAAALRARHGGDRRAMMDDLGRSIAELLPDEYRGAYGAVR